MLKLEEITNLLQQFLDGKINPNSNSIEQVIENNNVFFETSRLNADIVYDFIFKEEYESNISARIGLIKTLHLDDDTIEEYFLKYSKNVIQGKREFSSLFYPKENNTFRTFYRNFVDAMLIYDFSQNIVISSQNDYDNEIDFLNSFANNNETFYFRGQSDFGWGLKPSLFRDFKFDKDYGQFIDNNWLLDIYQKTGLLDKYSSFLNYDNIIKSNPIDYNFLSFMQHAISYSPLIDFTNDINIAYRFALMRNNPNHYLYKDSSIYILKPTKNTEIVSDDIIKQYTITNFSKKIKPGTLMIAKDINSKPHPIDFTTIEKIREHLRPKYIILDKSTNDRMKYQKGKFILFYDYVSINGNVYYLLNNDLNLIKHKVHIDDKDEIIKHLDSINGMSNSNLMDPYQIFND